MCTRCEPTFMNWPQLPQSHGTGELLVVGKGSDLEVAGGAKAPGPTHYLSHLLPSLLSTASICQHQELVAKQRDATPNSSLAMTKHIYSLPPVILPGSLGRHQPPQNSHFSWQNWSCGSLKTSSLFFQVRRYPSSEVFLYLSIRW